MATLFNQTNVNPKTSLFITRQEVIEGLSTLAGDLSGANLSTLFYNPDPKFSTVTVNASGNIQGGAQVYANGALGISSVLMTYNKPYANLALPFQLGIRDAANNYQLMALGGVLAKGQVFTNAISQYMVPNANGFFDANSNTIPITTLNTATGSVSLTNISSINGQSPSGGTTFNTLTGNTLIAQQVNATQLVGVSSINGLMYQSPLVQGYTQTVTSVTLNSNVPQTGITITLPAGYLKQNTTYLYDVPFQIVSWPPGSPSGFNMFIGIRLGGNGQINYQIPLYIEPTTQGALLSLTGIAQTNSSSPPTSQIIEVIFLQRGATPFSPSVQSPTSTGGLNVYTIQPVV